MWHRVPGSIPDDASGRTSSSRGRRRGTACRCRLADAVGGRLQKPGAPRRLHCARPLPRLARPLRTLRRQAAAQHGGFRGRTLRHHILRGLALADRAASSSGRDGAARVPTADCRVGNWKVATVGKEALWYWFQLRPMVICCVVPM